MFLIVPPEYCISLCTPFYRCMGGQSLFTDYKIKGKFMQFDDRFISPTSCRPFHELLNSNSGTPAPSEVWRTMVALRLGSPLCNSDAPRCEAGYYRYLSALDTWGHHATICPSSERSVRLLEPFLNRVHRTSILAEGLIVERGNEKSEQRRDRAVTTVALQFMLYSIDFIQKAYCRNCRKAARRLLELWKAWKRVFCAEQVISYPRLSF